MTDPSASKIEAEVKFSDGINSKPFHCLSFSLSMMSKISGSTVFKSSLQAFGHVMPGFSFAYASAFVEYVLVVAAVIDARCFHSLKKESNKRILKCQFVRKTNTASSHKEKREAKRTMGPTSVIGKDVITDKVPRNLITKRKKKTSYQTLSSSRDTGQRFARFSS